MGNNSLPHMLLQHKRTNQCIVSWHGLITSSVYMDFRRDSLSTWKILTVNLLLHKYFWTKLPWCRLVLLGTFHTLRTSQHFLDWLAYSFGIPIVGDVFFGFPEMMHHCLWCLMFKWSRLLGPRGISTLSQKMTYERNQVILPFVVFVCTHRADFRVFCEVFWTGHKGSCFGLVKCLWHHVERKTYGEGSLDSVLHCCTL